MIVDTHAHLDDRGFDDDLISVIERAKNNGIEKIVIPGADINDLPKAREISHKFEGVYFAVGVHPYHIDDFDLAILEEFAKDSKCVAIGECGLDYYRLSSFESEAEKLANKNRQKEVFVTQIELATRLQKPLIIHSRDANEGTFEILKEVGCRLKGGVLHCYNASKLLLELKDFGFYFGIGGVLTFKNAKNLVEILPQIPLDRLLIETDAPYLTPEPFRGKRNEPSHTKLVVAKISELLNLEISKVEEISTQNAARLFGF